MSAPAGTGKTTLMERLSQEFDAVVQSLSCTTRPPREGELEGIHYHFLTQGKFEEKVRKGKFLEHVNLYGFRYGTSRKWVEERLNRGQHVFLVIDTQGGLLLKGHVEAVWIFVKPPSLTALESRLRRRDTETEEKLQERLRWAEKELKEGESYPYQIINEDLDTAYAVLRSILIAEDHKET